MPVSSLDKRRDDEDVPQDSAWVDVPGLQGVRWRRASSDLDFKSGTKGPLYYDVAIALRE
jgi:hypothetical protein